MSDLASPRLWLAPAASRVPIFSPSRRQVLRGLATAIVGLAAGVHPEPLVSLGPQQAVRGCNPILGVHTRLTDEVEEWKIKRTLEMVREMGAHWVVEYFPWAYVEPQPGRFSWAHADLTVKHAARQGLKLVARLGYVPQWARPTGSASSYLDPDHYDDFARFCSRFAQRYREEVAHVIVWNEPNLALEWGFRPPDPAGYAELLHLCYGAIKAEAPETVVLGGALAPVPAPLDDPQAMDDLTFLERACAVGACQSMDALAVHAYGWASPPEDDPEPGRVNFRRAELLRAALGRLGYTGMPAYVTEAGWNDHPRWTRAVSPALRLDYTVRAYEFARHRWSWCPMVATWAFRFPWLQHSYQDYFAFVTPGFQPRPVYDAVRLYAHQCR
ncbi:MAG: hypothetical protein HPY83_09360 [Anaerolineae bacterium]|nr:hypothetical protein [Anaerolineae bacterium]